MHARFPHRSQVQKNAPTFRLGHGDAQDAERLRQPQEDSPQRELNKHQPDQQTTKQRRDKCMTPREGDDTTQIMSKTQ